MKLKLKTALQSNPYDPQKGDEFTYARYLRYVVDGFYGKSNEEVRNIWRKESRKMTKRRVEKEKQQHDCDTCTYGKETDEWIQLATDNEGDTISRQDAMNELKEMQNYISCKIFCAENNPTEYAEDYIRNMEQQSVGIVHAEHRILELPSAQPEIIRCKDCKHLQKCRSEESAKKFGQIYTCAKNVFDCPKPKDFCSHGERRTEK